MEAKTVLLASVAVLALGGTAQADHMRGWYVGIEGGANWVQDNNVVLVSRPTTTLVTFTTPATASFDTGWAVLATVGYGFGGNWRIEGEAGYRANKIDKVVTVSNSTTIPNGHLNELTLMANVLYDLPLGSRLVFTLGAGAGADYAKLDTSGPFDDRDWFFAYQGLAGFSYAISPRTDLTLNYRYLRVADPSFHDRVTTFAPSNVTVSMDDLQKHTLTLGLRFALNGPEEPVVVATPPPPPPPPPPSATHFLIFFGFNKCNITAEADNVLSEAAEAAKTMGSAAVTIVGHTDTSGSARYNQKLSECRSGAAKSNLVSKGVPEGAITATGRGETELMVQTGDGVKEPQNRRATVDLQ